MAGHYYSAQGTPCHTQITMTGVNKGKERNTNLRDARKLNLYPSVTTILGIMDKGALTSWKINQAVLASLTCPRKDDETEKAWVYRVIHQDATEGAKAAAEEGTRIHNVLEDYYNGQTPHIDDAGIVQAVTHAIKAEIGDYGWIPEETSVHAEQGYAGTVDLHSPDWVLDFKTKDGDLEKVQCYDDHYRQLAAYRESLGLPEAQCANVFISRDSKDENGRPFVKVVIHKEAKTVKAWEEFKAILNCWQVIKGYKPSEEA